MEGLKKQTLSEYFIAQHDNISVLYMLKRGQMIHPSPLAQGLSQGGKKSVIVLKILVERLDSDERGESWKQPSSCFATSHEYQAVPRLVFLRIDEGKRRVWGVLQ